MTTGELLSLYRQEAGLTIDELVEKSGVPKGTINKIISGDTKGPSLPTMKALAKALGKTLNDFAEDEDAQEKENPPIPTEPEQGENRISIKNAEDVLAALGYIQPGEDLTEADFKILNSVLDILDTWFQEKG